MTQSVRTLLESYGYGNITLNVVGVSLGLKKVGDQGFAVVTIDETTGNMLTREQFEHISFQIRSYIQNRGCVHTYFLYLLISEDDDSRRRLFAEDGNCWRIIPTKGRVMVFEDTVAEFLELRRPLEALFPARANVRRDFRAETPRAHARGSFPKCNIAVVVLNVLVFIITDVFLFSSSDALVEWGALGWYEVFREGQWYRLITSMFMHGGIDHIFSNMLVLTYLGNFLEQQIGSLRYCIIYLGAGLLAGFTSMGYNMLLEDYTVAIGASGAVFGVMGSLLCLVLFFRERAGNFNVRQIAVMLFFSLYGGFTSQGVDNAAHVGGLLAGFLLTVLIMMPERGTKYR